VEYAMGCHCGCDFEKSESGRRKQEAGSKAIGKRAVGGGLHEVGCRFGPQDKDFNLKTSNEARLFLNQKPRTGCLS